MLKKKKKKPSNPLHVYRSKKQKKQVKAKKSEAKPGRGRKADGHSTSRSCYSDFSPWTGWVLRAG